MLQFSCMGTKEKKWILTQKPFLEKHFFFHASYWLLNSSSGKKIVVILTWKYLTLTTTVRTVDYSHMKAKSKILIIQIQLNKYLEVGCKGLVFCRNKGWIMDKELMVPNWVLIVGRKYPKSPKTFQPKITPSPKVLDFWKNKIEDTPILKLLMVKRL